MKSTDKLTAMATTVVNGSIIPGSFARFQAKGPDTQRDAGELRALQHKPHIRQYLLVELISNQRFLLLTRDGVCCWCGEEHHDRSQGHEQDMVTLWLGL